jgi:hypothetical protein
MEFMFNCKRKINNLSDGGVNMSIQINNVITPSAEQWKNVILGARNPLNSWEKSDSVILDGLFVLGKNDENLMKKLCKAGPDHRKFMRMLPVQCNIVAPLFWVAEHDTYKIGTTRNSCSFMHKGVSKPFSLEDFSIEDGAESELLKIINTLNFLRENYLKNKDIKIFRMIRELLPQGYNVKYTWCANYEVLYNIYYARKNHRLEEWKNFCDWIEKLPFSYVFFTK